MRFIRVLLWAVLPAASTGLAATPAERPNVILILADDQGSVDLNCYGAKDLHTPNLDRLAEKGVRFTRFYVAAPVCSPSRAAILTGRYTLRAGVPGNVSSQPDQAGMPPDEITIAETLRGAGYRTALFGKWHLGTRTDSDPLAQGFDEFTGHLGGCIDNYSHFFYWNGPNRHDLWRTEDGRLVEHWEYGTHFSEIVVREAHRFITENRDRPFFLFLPINTPHYPLQAPDRFRRMFEHLPEPRRAYAAFIAQLDDTAGRIIDKVAELGLRERTLIIYLSDHGHSTEDRANFGGGSAGPYRGAKFSMFEGGLRVPCIMSLPGVIPEGETRDQLAASIDLHPTIAALCDAEIPGVPERIIDGRSLKSVLESGDAPPTRDRLAWQLGRQKAFLDGDWKLILDGHDTDRSALQGEDKVFLSNLAEDIGERRNYAADHPDVVERLRGLHEAWAEEVTKDIR